MATRTVRLDDESEAILAAVCKETGLSVSAVLKRGLTVLHEALRERADPWAIYSALDLGPGDPHRPPARRAKQSIEAVLRAKTR